MGNDRALALRVILGLLMGNLPLWIGLGAGVGLAFAASLTGRRHP